jgi:hypothetical protein
MPGTRQQRGEILAIAHELKGLPMLANYILAWWTKLVIRVPEK